MKRYKFLLIPIFCLLLAACIVGCSGDKDYSVIFNSVGGTSVSKVYVGKDSDIVFPQEPTKTGYAFGGWYKENLTDKIEAGYFKTNTKDKVLYAYAKWIPKAYDVTFEYNGADANNTVVSQTVNYGEDYNLPTPTKRGHTFSGWYTRDNGLGDLIVGTSKVKIANDHKLYTYWIKNSQIISVANNYDNVEVVEFEETSDVSLGYAFNARACGVEISFLVTPEIVAVADGGDEVVLAANNDGYYSYGEDGYCKYINDELQFFNFNGVGYESVTVSVEIAALFSRTPMALSSSTQGVVITKDGEAYKVVVSGKDYFSMRVKFSDYTTVNITVGEAEEATQEIYSYWAKLAITIYDEVKIVDGVAYSYNAIEDTLYSTISSTDIALRVKYGDVITTLPTIEDTDWLTFDGWYSLGANGKKYENGKSVLDTQGTLYLEPRFIPKQCQIEFITNKNSTNVIGSSLSRVLATRNVDINSLVTVDSLPTPTINGYVFKGWATDEEGNNVVENDFIISSNGTLYAVWEAKSDNNEYSTYLYVNEAGSNYVKYADKTNSEIFLTLTPVPEHENKYSFSYDEKIFTFDSAASSVTEADGATFININARQKVFYTNHGVFAYAGSSMIVCPHKDGYQFEYWVNNPYSVSATAYNFSIVSSKDIILYSSFKPYTTLVEYNKSENVEDGKYSSITIEYNKSVISPSLGQITNGTNNLYSWYYINSDEDKIDVTNQTVGDVLTDIEGSTIQLYPRWLSLEASLKVSYKVNGREAFTSTVKYNEEIGILPVSKLSGYYFLGWSYNIGEDKYMLQSTDKWNAESKWLDIATYDDESDQYTITVEAEHLVRLFAVVVRYNNGQLFGFEWLPEAVAYGEKIILPELDYFQISYEGYESRGYNTQPDGKGTSYAPGDELTVNMTTSLYIVWQPKVSAVVYLDEDNTQLVGMPDKSVKFGEKIGYYEYIDDKDNGYRKGFAGWKIVEEGSTSSMQIIITENHVFKTYQPNYLLYASWDKNNYYVRYMTYKTFENEEHIVSLGSSFTSTHLIGANEILYKTPRIPTQDGFVFDGWVDADGNDFVFGGIINQDIYIFARWKAVREVAMSYGYETTATLDSIELIDGVSVGKLPYLYRKGYTFDGWYTEINGGGIKITSETIWNNSASTLYANWILVNGTTSFYKVRLIVDGVESAGSYISATVTEPEAPIKTGYRFLGWYTSLKGGEKYDFANKMISSDITLYARFE